MELTKEELYDLVAALGMALAQSHNNSERLAAKALGIPDEQSEEREELVRIVKGFGAFDERLEKLQKKIYDAWNAT